MCGGETFTGLRLRQFEGLLRAVRERGGNGPGGGRPWCLSLADRVLLVAVYYRTNLTMRQLAPRFGISSVTVCRVIQRLRPLLALEPAARPTDAADRLWIVDGTLIPVRDRTVGASSRNYRFSANVQVIVDADTRLVVATAWPAPGNKADAHVWRNSGLPAQCQGVPYSMTVPTSTPGSSSRTANARDGPSCRARRKPMPNTARSAPAWNMPSRG